MPPVRRGFVSVVGAFGAISLIAGSAMGQGYVYPTKGQSPQQQQKDQGECSGWAMQQSGANPAAVPPPPGPEGQVLRGAGRGAAIGAAAGAATGALIGHSIQEERARAYGPVPPGGWPLARYTNTPGVFRSPYTGRRYDLSGVPPGGLTRDIDTGQLFRRPYGGY